MSASIRFTGSPGPLQVVAGAISLSNFNNTGVLGWHWELLDRPVGSAAVIAAPFAAAPSFTADVPGSYRVRLRTYADAGRTVLDATDLQIAYILRATPFDWRQPAAGETIEVDPLRGWATSREEESIDTHSYLLGGLQSAFDQVPTIELGGGVLAVREGGSTVFRFNGTSGRAELGVGSVTAPALAFESDPDTGLYRSGTDALAVAAGGVLTARFMLTGAQPQLSLAEGSASLPGLVFVSDTDTGIFHPAGGATAIASGGNEVARFTASGLNRPQVLMQTGSAPSTHPHYSFASATTTGVSFADGGLALLADGQRPLLLTGTASTPRALLQFGTAANPSLAFSGDQTTGIFRQGASSLAIATGGAERVRFLAPTSLLSTHWNPDTTNTRDIGASGARWRSIFAATSVDVSGGLLRADVIEVMTDGTAAAPSLRWGTYGDNGFFGGGADRLSVSVDGAEVMRWRNNAGSVKALIADGSLAHPGLAFISEENTGLHRPAAGRFSFVTEAVEALTLDGLLNAATGNEVGANLRATVNKATSGNYTALQVDVTQTAAPGTDNRLLDLRVGGTSQVFVSNIGNVRAGNGTALQPAYGFTTESGLGLHRPGAAILGVAVGNSDCASFRTTGFWPALDNGRDIGTASLRWRDVHTVRTFIGDGTLAAPSLVFGADTDTGLYRVGADDFAVTAGGTQVVRFTAPSAVPRAVFADGTAAQPSIQFAGTTSGIYHAGSQQIGVTFSGSLRWAFGSNSLAATNGGVNSIHATASGGSFSFAGRMDGAASAGSSLTFRQHGDLPFTGNNIAQSLVGLIANVNQTGTSAFSALQVGANNTALGSGAQRLLDLRIDGTTVFAVRNSTIAAQRGQAQASDGSAAAPSYAFLANSDTGIYRPATNSVGVANGGIATHRFAPVGMVPVTSGLRIGDSVFTPASLGVRYSAGYFDQIFSSPDSTATVPAFAFDGFKQTGLFCDDANGYSLAFSHQGSAYAFFHGVQSANSGVMQGISFSPILENIGTAGFDAFKISVLQPLSSGSGEKRLFVLQDGSTDRFTIHSATGQLRGMRGTEAVPTYAFLDGTDDGIFSPVKNQVAITIGGSARFSVTDSAIFAALPVRVADGNAFSPSYSFFDDVAMGMYRVALNTLGFGTNNTLRFSISTTQLVSTLPLISPVGSVSAPSLAFTGDTNTGIYRSSAGRVAIAGTGTLVAHFEGPSAATSHLKFWNGNIGGSTSPETNAIYTKNVPSAWLKANGLTSIDDRFGVASIASDGGTPAATTVTFHNAATSAFAQAFVATASGSAAASNARWSTVDNYATNSCRVRHFQWNGSAIVQVATGGEWSLLRFATHT